MKILFMLEKQFNQVYILKELLESGATEADAAAKMELKPWLIKRLREQSRGLKKADARRYLELSRGRGSRKDLYDRLQKYLYSYEEAGRRLRDICRELIEAEQNPLPSEQSFPKFEVSVSETSEKIGKTIGELRLWQATGATVIAIRRNKNMIISPGPYAELYAGDVIIFVGDKDGALALDRYINRADEA